MPITNFFSFRKRKINKENQLNQLQNPDLQTALEAGSTQLAAEEQKIPLHLQAKSSATKILAVQDGDHSTVLVDYVIKMAQKLDCEIIALDVSEEPLNFQGERRERETNRFMQRATKNGETLQLKAEAVGVSCQHVVRIGNQEKALKELSAEDSSIRYVLIKPEQQQISNERRRVRVPVVDLNCSSL